MRWIQVLLVPLPPRDRAATAPLPAEERVLAAAVFAAMMLALLA